jgi:hypothetical protein
VKFRGHIQKRNIQQAWLEVVEDWYKVDSKVIGRDDEGHDVIQHDETLVTRVKATCVNNDGSEIACYATSQAQLEGLKRLHIYAAGR